MSRVAGQTCLLVLIAVLSGCRTSASPRGAPEAFAGPSTIPPAGRPSPAAPQDESLEIGRRVLAQHCGSCHLPDLLTSSPRALAVFSLADADWSIRMSDAQICEASLRLKKGKNVEAIQAQAFADAADEILKRRGSPGCGR